MHPHRPYAFVARLQVTLIVSLLSVQAVASAGVNDTEMEPPTTPAAMLDAVKTALDRNRDFDVVQLLLGELLQKDAANPAVYVEAARFMMKIGGRRHDDLDMGPAQFQPGVLEQAQAILDHALELDPSRADTYVLYGHLAFQQGDQAKAKEMLRRAAQLGTRNPWLIVNEAEVLYQQAELDGDEALRQQALALFAQAVAIRPLHPSANGTAARDLTVHYLRTRQLDEADRSYRQWIEVTSSAADVRLRYAIFLMDYRNDPDGALEQARASVAAGPSKYGNAFLARMLALKASKYLIEEGDRAKAWPLFEEAQRIYPNLDEVAIVAAHQASQFIAVRGLHEFGIPVLEANNGGFTVLHMAIQFTGSADAVYHALEMGADPNAYSSDHGTALHSAILGGYPEIVALLLRYGADPTIPFTDGRTPLEMARQRPNGREIVELLEAALAGNETSAARPTASSTASSAASSDARH